MDLTKAQLGERFEFYDDIMTSSSGPTFVGTIVGVEESNLISHAARDVLLVGWKNGEKVSKRISDNARCYSAYYNTFYCFRFVSNMHEYTITYPVYAMIPVASKIVDSPVVEVKDTPIGGCHCSKCNMPNPWADANQPDGSYICYECTNRWWKQIS